MAEIKNRKIDLKLMEIYQQIIEIYTDASWTSNDLSTDSSTDYYDYSKSESWDVDDSDAIENITFETIDIGCKLYFYQGKLHRTDGPAATWSNGNKEYWIGGVLFTKEKWFLELTPEQKILAAWDL